MTISASSVPVSPTKLTPSRTSEGLPQTSAPMSGQGPPSRIWLGCAAKHRLDGFAGRSSGRRRHAIKLSGSRAASHAAHNRRNNPIPQMLRKRPRHPCLRPALRMNEKCARKAPLRVRSCGKRSSRLQEMQVSHDHKSCTPTHETKSILRPSIIARTDNVLFGNIVIIIIIQSNQQTLLTLKYFT